MDALHLRRRHVKLDRLRRQFRRVHLHEAGAAHAGIDLGQPQQRIEDPDHAVDIGDRRVNFGESFIRRRSRERQFLETRTQFRKRRAQIVGDRIGDVADAMEELFDLVEHAIDRCAPACRAHRPCPGPAADGSGRPA